MIVILGLAIIFLVSQGAGDIFLALLLFILCGFFGIILAPFILILRTKRGLKYRRRFIYCLIGTINFCLGAISLIYALRIKIHQAAAISISLLTFLIGAFILLDIFFGKRDHKQQPEFLSTEL
jgi:drug/metabolite transporter (DMT)-like permease